MAALAAQKAAGVSRKLAGFEMIDRGIPREGYEILKEGMPAGVVTSGTFGPAVKKNIGLGYVQAGLAAAGNELDIRIRDRVLKARIVPLPFYRRNR